MQLCSVPKPWLIKTAHKLVIKLYINTGDHKNWANSCFISHNKISCNKRQNLQKWEIGENAPVGKNKIVPDETKPHESKVSNNDTLLWGGRDYLRVNSDLYRRNKYNALPVWDSPYCLLKQKDSIMWAYSQFQRRASSVFNILPHQFPVD